MLPDITNLIFVHPYLGWLAGHTIPFAGGQDFLDFPQILDHWTYHVWLLSHSLLFWAIAFLPFCRRSRTAQLAAVAYASHLIADIPSHTGIYGLEPLYPIPYIFDGWFDAEVGGNLISTASTHTVYHEDENNTSGSVYYAQFS